MLQVRIIRLAVALTFAAFGSLSPAWSQCQSWTSRFGQGAPNSAIDALATFDDGSGPALFVGGNFTYIGEMAARAIARWDGASWSVPGGGVTSSTGNRISSLLVFDDGSGPALYAGGAFDEIGNVSALNVARWDGAVWSPLGAGLGSNNEVTALVIFDDGGGPALYAAVGPWPDCTAPGSRVWKWDGASWSQVGAASDCQIFALAVFDDGGGPALYAGGSIIMPNGREVANVSRWDGATWSAVGTGLANTGVSWSTIYALAAGDDGNGPGLFAGGDLEIQYGSIAEGVAKWNGTNWSPLPSSTFHTGNRVSALTFFDDGSGTALFAGGSFAVTPGGHSIGKWNGSSWSSPGGGVFRGGTVHAFAPFDDGSGLALHVGGDFTAVGGTPAPSLASWDGSAWHASAQPGGTNGGVFAMHSAAVGGAPKLYAGGAFTQAGHAPASHIASWDGYGWQPLGSGTGGANPNVTTLASFDDGGGVDLYVGGAFTSAGGAPANRIARWNGAGWSTLGSGVNDIVRAAAVYDDGSGPALYVAGHFTMAGGAPANRIAKWNGSSWSPLGSGTDHWVLCLAVFDDGSGSALYAGGLFGTAGGTPAAGVARWNGSSWSAVGNPGSADSLTVFDDGNGPALYRRTSTTIMKLDSDSLWVTIGVPDTGVVDCLGVHDDGGGPALIAGGRFAGINGVSAKGVARWDGAAWSPLGEGLDLENSDTVYSLAVHDDSREGGPDLYLGGVFERTWDSGASENIAEWYGCARPGRLFCFGNGALAPCPCGNDGVGTRGCQNSAGTNGARLTTSGHLNPDTVVLHVSDELPSALTIFLQGNARVGPLAFGDGLRCAGGALKRLYMKNAVGGSVSVPGGGDLSITARSAALGDVIPPGAKRYYHTYYRDPSPTFCASPQGSTFNSSNGIEILW